MPDEILKPTPDPTVLTTEALMREVGNLEKWITREFGAVERARVEQKADTKEKVDAALAAQKEATSQTNARTDTVLGALSARLTTAEDRLTRIESIRAGARETVQNTRVNINLLVGIAGLVLAAAIFTLGR